jgi:DNA replication protein DnaC
VLFTLLTDRYERRSVMITSNLVFSQLDQTFKDPMTTVMRLHPEGLATPKAD